MNFEVGNWYRTRDGRKVRCVATDGDKDSPNVFVMPGRFVISRSEDGLAFRDQVSDYDIIGPWIDKPVVDWSAMPAWANWVAMDANGTQRWHGGKPSIVNDHSWHASNGLSGMIPPSHRFTFSGDWKDSLVGRPKEGGAA